MKRYTTVKIHEKIHTVITVIEEYKNKKHAPPGIVMKDSKNPPYGIVDFQERLKPTWKSDSGQRACGIINTFFEKKVKSIIFKYIYETKIHIFCYEKTVIRPVS